MKQRPAGCTSSARLRPRLVQRPAVRPAAQQELEHVQTPAHGCEVEGRDVELPPGLDVGVPGDEQLRDAHVAVVYSDVEAGVALLRTE